MIDIKKVWVIIPAYNESKTIASVIKKTKQIINNIIVVDDGSKDLTYEEALKEDISVLKHIINMGKGSALKTGCEYAIKQGAKILIAMDADGQHDPQEIPHFLKYLNEYDIVLGYRRLNKNMPTIMKLGNVLINYIAKLLYGIKLKDTQGGFRAFTLETYQKIKWSAQDYSMESEMIANMAKHNLKYKQLPIETIYNNKYKGTTVLDGIRIVFNMLIWKFKRS